MPFRLIFVSFAKCENSIEVAGHQHTTLTQTMAHVRTEVHNKLSFNDVDPNDCYFHILRRPNTFSHLTDLVSLSHLALICLTHLAALVSLTHLG